MYFCAKWMVLLSFKQWFLSCNWHILHSILLCYTREIVHCVTMSSEGIFTREASPWAEHRHHGAVTPSIRTFWHVKRIPVEMNAFLQLYTHNGHVCVVVRVNCIQCTSNYRHTTPKSTGICHCVCAHFSLFVVPWCPVLKTVCSIYMWAFLTPPTLNHTFSIDVKFA